MKTKTIGQKAIAIRPWALYARAIKQFQSSPIAIAKIDVKPMPTLSKLGRGGSPPSYSSGSTTRSFRKTILCPKSSMPRSVKINMNISNSTENVLTSLTVTIIFDSIWRKLVQLLASLKTRRRRTPLKADRLPPPAETESAEISVTVSSIKDSTTIKASKMLKESRAYSLKPSPMSLMTISTTNAHVKKALRL